MNFDDYTFYLASKSPRRRKLIKLLNIKFKSFSVDLNEELTDGEHPVATVKRLAKEKMLLAQKKIKAGIIITADTIVVLGDEILGKPSSPEEAVEYLKRLSGSWHTVITGFSILLEGRLISSYEETRVKFKRLTAPEIEWYVSTGEPLDKAGAYGVQGKGALFIERIDGDYYNVMGLPLGKIYDILTLELELKR